MVCDDGSGGSGGSGGSTTTKSLDSLSDAADQAKEDADKASAEISAADAAINAANNAARQLEQLEIGKFTSGLPFKCQNENNIITSAGVSVQIDSSGETSSSAYPVPTTCASLLKLMDDITETLTNNPTGVTALLSIKTPLAIPCSADDITKLTTKKNTAMSTADSAVTESSRQQQLKSTTEATKAVSGAPEATKAVSGAHEATEAASGLLRPPKLFLVLLRPL